MKKSLVVMALILVCAMLIPCFASAVNFTKEADALNDMGLFLGTNNGYDLDKKPTRAQAAVMLVRFLGKVDEALELEWTAPFTDVPDWAKPYVQYLYNEGLTVGYSTTTYAPDDDCSAQMYATFMLRALNYMDINPDDYKPSDEEPGEETTPEATDEGDTFDHIEFVRGENGYDGIYRIPLAMYQNIPTVEDGVVDIDNVSIILGNGGGTYNASHWRDNFFAAEVERHELGEDAKWEFTIFAEDTDGDGVNEHYMKAANTSLLGCPEHGGWTDATSEGLTFTGKDGKTYTYDFHFAVEWAWNGTSASEEDEAEATAVEFVPAFTYAEAIAFATEKALITEANCDTENFLRDHMVAIAYTALGVTINGTEQKLIEKLAEEGVVTAEQVEKYLSDAYLEGKEEETDPVEAGVDEFDHIEFVSHDEWNGTYRIPLAMYENIPSENGVVDLTKVILNLNGSSDDFQADYWVGFVRDEASRHIEGDVAWEWTLSEEDKDGDGTYEHYMTLAYSGLFGCPEHAGWTNETSEKLSFTGKDGNAYSYDFHMIVDWPW